MSAEDIILQKQWMKHKKENNVTSVPIELAVTLNPAIRSAVAIYKVRESLINNKLISLLTIGVSIFAIQKLVESLQNINEIIDGKNLLDVLTNNNETVKVLEDENEKNKSLFDKVKESASNITSPKQTIISNGKLDQAGIDFIKDLEKFSPTAYWDVDGYSIGYGHHGNIRGRKIQKGDRITQAEGEQLLKDDITKYENYVNKVVKVPVTQNMFNAMVAYAYNVGYLGPKFLKLLNSKRYQEAVKELNYKMVKNAQGKIEEQNKNRAIRQRELFLKDLVEDTFKEGSKVIQQIAKQTKSTEKHVPIAQKGGKIGNIKLQSDVVMSEKGKEYASRLNAKGLNLTITSGMEGKHAGTKDNIRSHYSGYKIDISVMGKSDTQLIHDIIEILKEPSTIEVAIENMGKRGTNIVNTIIKNNKWVADINNNPKLRSNHGRKGQFLRAYHNPYATGPHLDVLFYIPPNQVNSKSSVPTPPPSNKQSTNSKTNSSNNEKVAFLNTPSKTVIIKDSSTKIDPIQTLHNSNVSYV